MSQDQAEIQAQAVLVARRRGLTLDWHGGSCFRLRRPGSQGRQFSICTSTKGRLEAKYLSSVWRQYPDVEVVLAEFGPSPFLAFPVDYLHNVDCYVYAHCPWASPFAPSWWKNVPAYASTGRYVLHVDCDIAVSPRFYDWAVDWIGPGRVIWPTQISSTRKAITEPAKFEDLSLASGAVNYERVLCWDSSDMRKLGGWPEWYTGRRHTWMLMKRQVRTLQVDDTCPVDFFSHVPPLKLADSYSDEEKRSPVGKTRGRSFWSLEKNGPNPQAHNAEWPIPGWEPGQPDRYEKLILAG